MKKLAAALTKALRESSVSRAFILEHSTIKPTALSRYLNAKALPTAESLVQIMSQLPEKQALEVFSAYLQEILPADLVSKIALKSSLNKASESSLCEDSCDYSQSNRSEELEDSIDLLRELSYEREDIKQLLITLCDTLRGGK